jgi:hypothetical protein
MEKKMTKMGRPRKPLAEKCGKAFSIHITRAEHAMLKAEAKRRKMSLSGLLMSPWREKMRKESRQDALGLTQRTPVDARHHRRERRK